MSKGTLGGLLSSLLLKAGAALRPRSLGALSGWVFSASRDGDCTDCTALGSLSQHSAVLIVKKIFPSELLLLDFFSLGE